MTRGQLYEELCERLISSNATLTDKGQDFLTSVRIDQRPKSHFEKPGADDWGAGTCWDPTYLRIEDLVISETTEDFGTVSSPELALVA